VTQFPYQPGKVSCLSVGLVLIVAFADGCVGTRSELRGEGLVNIQSYLPLAVGNKWSYATSFQGQPQADLVVSLVKKQGPFFLDDRPKPSRYAFDNNGLRDGNKRYLLKLPLEVGTKWMSVADLNTVEHYRILDVNRKVKVPAGVFSGCVVVRMEVRMTDTRSMRNDMTFAPGVGIVEVRTWLLDGSKALPQSVLQLKKFEQAGKNS